MRAPRHMRCCPVHFQPCTSTILHRCSCSTLTSAACCVLPLGRYGSGDTWTQPYTSSGVVQCSDTVFGDPLPDVLKECRCSGTGIFGVSVSLFPATTVDRPICGESSSDSCCPCTLTPDARMCSNATGCSEAGTGGTLDG